MGIQDLQTFIQSQLPGAAVPVDLLKIGRNFISTQRRLYQKGGKGGGAPVPTPYRGRLCLVVDGECCLDRLYGGYFSDWACGGQWNRMVQFLAVLVNAIQTNQIEFAVFFNGCLEQERMADWIKGQQAVRQNVNQVLKHIGLKGTPPPKVWWVAPVCLRTCLRMALRHLNVAVMCTMDDHHQEVIAYCRENNFDGLLAEDAEYAVFDPPHYFSSEQLKLTYKGSLETKEYMLREVAKGLDLNPVRMCVFAALLGNYLLTDDDLSAFYKKVCNEPGQTKGVSRESMLKSVAAFVRSLPSTDNLDAIGEQIFGPSDPRIGRFKHCVQYYINGTKDGFLRYNPTLSGGGNRRNANKTSSSGKSSSQNQTTEEKPESTIKFASETAESEKDSLAAYKVATSGTKLAPEIVIESPDTPQETDGKEVVKAAGEEEKKIAGEKEPTTTVSTGTSATAQASPQHAVNGAHLLSSSSSSSSSSAASPNRLTPDVSWNTQSQRGNSNVKNGIDSNCNSNLKATKMLSVPPEVMRTASERHQKGLMSPYIYQILNQGEIKLSVLMEEEASKELPNIHILYRPVRQMVYAILFNLHHYIYLSNQHAEGKSERKVDIPEVKVKEWVWSKSNPLQHPDHVPAEPIGWAVPTVQKLWFGSAVDDKRRRLRAFLTCMRSDTQLILCPDYVPQHMLVMACVLRYIVSYPACRVLHRHELDAFIVQAFSPELMNAQDLQELQLPVVSVRGVQLAALFTQGIEMALLANDACGAPVPWLMCCPWLFFDGKLFHAKLHKATISKDMYELCDCQYELHAKVDKMKKAILEGMEPRFARSTAINPLPTMRMGLPTQSYSMIPPPPPRDVPPPFHHPMYDGRTGRNNMPGRRPVPLSGGKLQIAGVTVGSWGPNYGSYPGGGGRGGNRAGNGSGHRAGSGGGHNHHHPHHPHHPHHAHHPHHPQGNIGRDGTPLQVTNVGPHQGWGYQHKHMGNYGIPPAGMSGRPSYTPMRVGAGQRGGGTGAFRGRKMPVNNVPSNGKKKLIPNKKTVYKETEKKDSKGRGMTVDTPNGIRSAVPSHLLKQNGSGDATSANGPSCNNDAGSEESEPEVAIEQFEDVDDNVAVGTETSKDSVATKDMVPSKETMVTKDAVAEKGGGDGPDIIPDVVSANE